MLRVMIFIDGTWLYSNTPRLSEVYGQPDFRVDFGKLPAVLAEEVEKQLGGTPVDLVRTYLFGSYASNFDPRDADAVQRRRDFFSMLREEYHYEIETYPINFLGRRLRRVDREPGDTFEPKEKCVDISLATSMLYYAAIPQVYDIAIAVVGDQDFKPVLQHVRRLGKRVAIASIKNSCSPDYYDTRDEARVRDFDTIWLDELLARLELKYERHMLTCESPFHKGKREVWTTFHPRKGQKFFCDACRREFVAQRETPPESFVGSPAIASAASAAEGEEMADPALDEAAAPSPSADDANTANVTGGDADATEAVSAGAANGAEPEPAVAARSAPTPIRPILPFLPPPTAPLGPTPSGPAGTLSGFVKRRIPERGFGFIEGSDGRDYFFHLSDLSPGLFFEEVVEGTTVEFDVKKEPLDGRAGAAQSVRRRPLAAADSAS